jgi:hypothetical protein
VPEKVRYEIPEPAQARARASTPNRVQVQVKVQKLELAQVPVRRRARQDAQSGECEMHQGAAMRRRGAQPAKAPL